MKVIDELNIKIDNLTNENSQLKLENENLSSDEQSAKVSTYSENTDSTQQKSSYNVYITEYGSKYHRTGCRYLKKSKISIDKNDAISKGYSPCSVCNP
ncbi:MAG: hypothetical protein HFI37_02105 [Lachnospiraceae bacterium]|nr:hypothetical protein [Lachnospiraceae bacterium]